MLMCSLCERNNFRPSAAGISAVGLGDFSGKPEASMQFFILYLLLWLDDRIFINLKLLEFY
jgi:hypothetical protein